MNAKPEEIQAEAVLILAPLPEDAAALCDMVRAEDETPLPVDAADLGAAIDGGAGCIIMTEDALAPETLEALMQWASAQPAWSALPVLVMTRDPGRCPYPLAGGMADDRRSGLQLSFLQRPSTPDVLRNAIRNAVAARRRQYLIRDQLVSLKAKQDRVEMLGREVQHRAKNSLTKLSAMLRLTWRETDSPEDFIESYQRRIDATARGLGLMSQTDWRGATLAVLFETEASAVFGERATERLRCAGEDISLDYEAALALHLIAHELTTNALKYGAFSAPSGHVDVRWRRMVADGDASLEIEWREIGGPAVSKPTRKGFGSRIIEEALAMQIGGDVVVSFDPEGLRCCIRFPLKEVELSPEQPRR